MKAKLDNICKVDAGHIFYKFLAGDFAKRIGPVNLDALHRQKMTLIDVAAEEREAVDGSDREEEKQGHLERAADLDGLIGFLDAFQDMLVDDLHVWEYPEEAEDEPG